MQLVERQAVETETVGGIATRPREPLGLPSIHQVAFS